MKPFQYHDGPDPLEQNDDPGEAASTESIASKVRAYLGENYHVTPIEGDKDSGWQGFASTLHTCKNDTLPKQGHRHAAVVCFEDITSRLWMADDTGRRATQVRFCPFCGFEAYNSEPFKERTGRTVAHDVALTPPDRPDRVWRQYHSANRPVMSHCQFGTVHVMASDGCHAKVLNTAGAQLTVCCENLEPLAGERMLPKMRTEEEKRVARESGTASKRAQKEAELMAKYMGLGQ